MAITPTLGQFLAASSVLRFLANVFRYMSSSVRLSVVCRLSVCNVRAPYTQAIKIFVDVSMPFNTLTPDDIQVKFYGDRSRGTPPPVELNTTGVAKYSDFGPFRGYISESVQDRR